MSRPDPIAEARARDRAALLPLAVAYAAVFKRNPANGGDPVDIVRRDLRAFAGADAQRFVPGAPDVTAYNEGRRSVWLHIADMLRMAARETGRTNDDVD